MLHAKILVVDRGRLFISSLNIDGRSERYNTELGVLIGNGDALEQSRRLTAIVLDKTGTITQGRPAVTRICTAGRWDAASLLAIVAAAETGSEHPLGAAIVTAARDRDLALPSVERFTAIGDQRRTIPFGREQRDEHLADPLVVLDDQHSAI